MKQETIISGIVGLILGILIAPIFAPMMPWGGMMGNRDSIARMVSRLVRKLAAAKNPVRPSEGMAEGGVWGEFRHARADRIVAPPPARMLGGQNTKEKCPFLFRRNRSRANPKSKEHFSLVSAESARRWRGVLIRGGSPQNGF